MLIAGCGVNEAQIEHAFLLCKEHGGILVVWGTIAPSDADVEVTCRDTTSISVEGKET